MLVLHAVFTYQDGIALWAEDSDAAVTSPSEALRQARPHPFAASSATLAGLVDTVGSSSVVQLPSLRRSPLDSPELVRAVPRLTSRSGPSLLPWTVPTLQLDPATLVPLLAALVPVDAASSLWSDDVAARASDLDIRPAASLRHLADVAQFAEDLVDRGRVLPTLVEEADGVHARWRIVATGSDAVALQSLVASAPPALRAGAEHSSIADIVTAILDSTADALVRTRLPESFLSARRGRKPARIPAGELWADALTGQQSKMAADADAEALAELSDELQPWWDVGVPVGATLVLRLSDPGTATDDAVAGGARDEWRLDFLLRSTADPSLLVEASRVWSDNHALTRWLERPRETLLAELARAQRIYPNLEQGLRGAEPAGMVLDTDEAHSLLTQHATLLDEAGFEVLLPSWWKRRSRVGLRLSATPSDAGETESAFGWEQLCDFRWEIAVGEHGLTDEEMTQLTEAKAPLVRLRGEWVSVDIEHLARGVAFLNASKDQQMTAGDVLTLALADPEGVDVPLEIVDVNAGGWIGSLLDGTAAETIADVEPPESFLATLRPYQKRGLGWLHFLGRLGLGACLADDMGLGKTVQLLALEATARASADSSAASEPTLLLCPMSLISNWEAEAARFAPQLRVVVYHGRDRPHGEDLRAVLADADLVVTTYATVLGDIDELAEIQWQRIVLDEAQAIKNRLARTAKAVRRLRASQRIALTGTPVENRLAELWSIMDFLNPGMLGTPERFRTRLASPIERDHDEEATATLRRITHPYILRRVKTDPTIIDDLPEKIEIKQHYRLTVEQASLYQSVVDDMMKRIDESEGIERRGLVLATMTKLKQVCNHPAQLLHDRSVIGRRSGKLLRLEEVLEEILAEGDRVLCFTQFTEFAELLVPHLAARFDTDIAYLSGSTTRRRRSEMVERFQSGEGPPVFLLSLKAGGTGLNLTAANHVMHLDRWWNPAVENQATDRAFRIGQKRRVQVRKFIGVGTLEERIDQTIEEKKALAELAVGDGESWLTELSTMQLRELFELGKDAVDE